ncbi:hypothetical protein [Stieleria varia]|uniref:Uncharacterized protein n=1 Tax=Stieleria varia TaxID=2528005 RepID=A0A5C6B794_9BACT|nr:hypothetical protein [Stieleria varia]TWU06364.1 hypothetical protein Pla52n_20850 [Stieleria varia]
MPPGRRNPDRRRRVLYQSQALPDVSATAAERRAALKLREARQPVKAFGSRVHRRLRARWFSLVPVRRRSLLLMIAVLLGVGFLLSLAHHAAVSWPALAQRPELTRALRLDRPDSFGRWFQSMVLMLTAGASFLIYQLRRYRNDDYRGHYRLWRLMLVLLILASINAQVGMVQWTGDAIDAVFGKRVALSGAGWLRILLGVGGAVLTMRLIAEVARCRGALVNMIAAAALLAIPEAARWQFVTVDSLLISTLVIAAPLLGSACLLVACTAYLRQLYRQARDLPEQPIMERILSTRLNVFRPEREDEDSFNTASEDEASDDKPSGGWFSRWRKRQNEDDLVEQEKRERQPSRQVVSTPPPQRQQPQSQPSVKQPVARKQSVEEDVDENDEPTTEAFESKPPRRWFGLRRAKPDPEDNLDEQDEQDEKAAEASAENDDEQQEDSPKTKRRGGLFSGFRMRPKRELDEEDESEPEATAVDDELLSDDGESAPKPKKGLFGWLSRKKQADDDSDMDGGDEEQEEEAANAAEYAQQRSKPSLMQRVAQRRDVANNDADEDADGDPLDPDGIDWDSLSKSERRRLRKKLKRSGNAA